MDPGNQEPLSVHTRFMPRRFFRGFPSTVIRTLASIPRCRSRILLLQNNYKNLALILFISFIAVVAMVGCGGSASSPSSSSPATSSSLHSVALSWNASPSPVAGYNIYRGSQSGGPYTRLNSSLQPGTTFSDNSVQAGATYFYVTTAVDGSSQESAFSNESVSVIPKP